MATATVGRTNNHKKATGDDAATSSATSPVKPEEKKTNSELVEEHLPPLSLIFVVLICSGGLFVLSLRDALATGKIIAGPMDEAMQRFTDSITFFDGSLGWKSTQGGLSAIAAVTTDDNNMGGLFIRKIGGAAAAIVHLQKLLPLMFHPRGAEWMAGHFRPLYAMALVANGLIAAFYAGYLDDLKRSGAGGFATFTLAILAVESLTLLVHLMLQTKHQSSSTRVAVAMPECKTPNSITSRIVARTVAIVSGVISLVMVRDLVFPGFIFDFIPRDDIYLEWTGAFLHSPPDDSPEAQDQGLEAALFVGDKFVSQFMALHMLILVAYKFLTAFGIRYGNDGSGTIKCRMIWKTQALGDAFVLLLLRLFSAAALSASLDLRWHLMMFGYEMFILGLYAWF